MIKTLSGLLVATAVAACAEGSTSSDGDCYTHYRTPDSPPLDDYSDADASGDATVDAGSSNEFITIGNCLLRKSTIVAEDGGLVDVYVIVNCERNDNAPKL